MAIKKEHPSDGELEILHVLWESEPVTVKHIHEVLSQSKNIGYTTILKQIQRMFEKGMVSRSKEGKSHLYTSTIRKTEIQESLFKNLLKNAFKGSAMELAMHAIGKAKASPEEIKLLRQLLDKKEGGKNENS